jgi:hypothetical protein
MAQAFLNNLEDIMTKFIALFTVLASLSAHAVFLRPHFGQLSLNGTYSCTFTNNTGRDLDMKYVRFSLERRAGKERDLESKTRIDTVVLAGETVTVDSDITARYIGRSCAFIAR